MLLKVCSLAWFCLLKVKEEADRLQKEEEVRKAKEVTERLLKEEEERKAKEEAERLAKEEEERIVLTLPPPPHRC